ncbi:MAG: His/Gly/Thr/Pro-type tRNA ligase C-terminal domain-containing protein [Gemmatimonadales bacterium]
MLGVYRKFQEEFLGIPVVTGRKSESEKFAGALRTYALEALMQDNKALQMGTSHNLGQNFAKAFDISFQTADGNVDHVWSTSWGCSTRMIGGMIMTHSDDNGLICPPRLAQWQVVIVPIYKTDEERGQVLEAASRLAAELKSQDLRVHIDGREGMKPGAKYYEWELRGVPFRLELGPRDLASGNVMLARRTGGGKTALPMAGLGGKLHGEIETMQRSLFEAARVRREENSLRHPKTKAEFVEYLEAGGGFVYAGWCGDPAVEAEIKEQTKATIRVIPDAEFRTGESPAKCIWTGKPAAHEVIWARAY